MTALFFTVFFVAALAGAYMGTVLLVSFLLAFLALLLVPILLIINGIVMIKKEARLLGNNIYWIIRSVYQFLDSCVCVVHDIHADYATYQRI